MAKEEQKEEQKAVEKAPEEAPKGSKAEQAQAYQEKRQKARAAAAKEKTDAINAELKKAGKGSLRVACTDKVIGSLVEPKSGSRIPAAGHGELVVPGPIKDGSWLQSQLAAGLIRVVE